MPSLYGGCRISPVSQTHRMHIIMSRNDNDVSEEELDILKYLEECYIKESLRKEMES